MNYEKEKVDHYQKIKKYLCLYYKFNVSKNVQHYKTFWKINEQNRGFKILKLSIWLYYSF